MKRASLSLRLNARRGLSARLAHVFRTKLEVDHSYLGQESCHLEQLPRRSVGKLGRWWPSFVTDFLLIGRRETTSVSSLLIRNSPNQERPIRLVKSSHPGIQGFSRSLPLFATLFRQIFLKHYYSVSKQCFFFSSFFFSVRKYFNFYIQDGLNLMPQEVPRHSPHYNFA